jgi:hypothetical protein
MGSAVCDTDFRSTGRTIETLDFADKSVSELQSILQDGF